MKQKAKGNPFGGGEGTQYFASGVGMVKSVMKGGGGQLTMTLQKYKL